MSDQTDDKKPIYLKLKDAAALIGVTPIWLQRQTRSQGIPHIRLGRQALYEQDKLLAWVRQYRQPDKTKKTKVT